MLSIKHTVQLSISIRAYVSDDTRELSGIMVGLMGSGRVFSRTPRRRSGHG